MRLACELVRSQPAGFEGEAFLELWEELARFTFLGFPGAERQSAFDISAITLFRARRYFLGNLTEAGDGSHWLTFFPSSAWPTVTTMLGFFRDILGASVSS